MPFEPAVLKDLEDALSDAFGYHQELNVFLSRCGIPQEQIQEARANADRRNSARQSPYQQSPKRYVVQSLLAQLGALGNQGDKLVAALIDHIIRVSTPQASENGRAAIGRLTDRKSVARSEALERQEAAEMARENEEKDRERELGKKLKDRENLLQSFYSLTRENDAQKRGYELEKFLKKIFENENLDPRASFRLVGEQIDGSFSWIGRTFLVEAKWTERKIAGAEFGQFMYKIEGKSVDTRGLYISINGFSEAAIESLKGKGALKFVCMDGAHLVRCLQSGQSFGGILEKLLRHLGDTGHAYLPVVEL